MSTHKDVNFNTGTVATWFDSILLDTDGNFSLTVGSALKGSAKGLRVQFSNSNLSQGLTNMSVPVSDELRMVFWFDASNVAVVNSDHQIFECRIRHSGSKSLIKIDISTDSIGGSDDYKLDAFSFVDNDISEQTLINDLKINDTLSVVHCVDIRIVQESSSSGNDGVLEIHVDGVQQFISTIVQNFSAFDSIDNLHFIGGAVTSDLSGFLSFDEWLVDDDDQVDLGCDPLGFSGYSLVLGGGQP